ncbi:hypothetical protein [Frigoriflavimonas asaccharolytica]|uniref:Uncharacterized protein n=1 Tax=Frigoriflavimonas asaccharolytica TaxID=2735899 RepID=A0A8J8G7C0_9FLAO|nr:hypothetical protein [Frigoriflavimonas asaccharolytica]NRS92015.1 hypothetical protein [Frigoriflavimonas asaccharolytica]
MNKNQEILSHLQKKIEKHFGKSVSTATDCEELSNIIKKNLNENISAQTLRRFFALVKSNSGLGKYNLNLLCKFCGFADLESFTNAYSEEELKDFFVLEECQTKNYWERSEQICMQISESAEFMVSTHNRLLKFPLARKYFMEHHPMRDLLGTVYTQYFSVYLKFNRTNEAKIFAYGFLFHSAFLQQNEELIELYFQKIYDTQLDDDIHVIPAGLKYGILLLYADFTRNEPLFKSTFSEMKKTRLQYIKASQSSVCSFEYTVLESLIFTNRIDEMKYLIENNTLQKSKDLDFVPTNRKKTHDEAWNILCATAYCKMNDKQKTSYHLNKVNVENLGIGWKKYYSILYYFALLQNSEIKNNEEMISRLKKMIDETYFTYFEDKLQDFQFGK